MRRPITLTAMLLAAVLVVGCDHDEELAEEMSTDQDAPIVGPELEEDARLDDDVPVTPGDDEISLTDPVGYEDRPQPDDNLGDPERPPVSDAIQEPPPLPPDDPS